MVTEITYVAVPVEAFAVVLVELASSVAAPELIASVLEPISAVELVRYFVDVLDQSCAVGLALFSFELGPVFVALVPLIVAAVLALFVWLVLSFD